MPPLQRAAPSVKGKNAESTCLPALTRQETGETAKSAPGIWGENQIYFKREEGEGKAQSLVGRCWTSVEHEVAHRRCQNRWCQEVQLEARIKAKAYVSTTRKRFSIAAHIRNSRFVFARLKT